MFNYHMLGATMGTLEVSASRDAGTTWDSLWAASGDQGSQWLEGLIDLSAYNGDTINLRVRYTSGTNFTGDCSIDNFRLTAMPVIGCTDSIANNFDPLASFDDGSCVYSLGCTDPFASNYDSTATQDDGSCLFPGCRDRYASNYCATCNVSDPASCTYNPCNGIPFNDNFESYNLSGTWTIYNGDQSNVSLYTGAKAISDTVSLEFTGGTDLSAWPYTLSTNDTAVFSLQASHVSGANTCIDLTNVAAGSTVYFSFDAHFDHYYTNAFSWIRVLIDGVQYRDINGNKAHNNTATVPVLPGAPFSYRLKQVSPTFDLSPFVGQSINVSIETAIRQGGLNQYDDYVRVDNVNTQVITNCTYYSASAAPVSDATCNGGSDGSVSATAVNGVNGTDSVSLSFLWSDGQTTAVATGLAAGSYTCIVTDSVNGCSDTTASVSVGEPNAISVTATLSDATSPIANDGSALLTASGGEPCIVGSPILITEYDPGFPDAIEITNVSGDSVDVTGWTVQTSNSYSDINVANSAEELTEGYMQSGQIIAWSDAQTLGTYWGNNLYYGSSTSQGWIVLKDATGAVRDVFVANWPASTIANSTVGLQDLWVGAGFNASFTSTSNVGRMTQGFSAAAWAAGAKSVGVVDTNRISIPQVIDLNAYTVLWSTGDSTFAASNLSFGAVVLR
jgi:hypothetical protein